MPAFQCFKLGKVAMVHSGHGFNITNQYGAPLLSITYRTAAEAEAAHHAIEAALPDAIEVAIPG